MERRAGAGVEESQETVLEGGSSPSHQEDFGARVEDGEDPGLEGGGRAGVEGRGGRPRQQELGARVAEGVGRRAGPVDQEDDVEGGHHQGVEDGEEEDLGEAQDARVEGRGA